MDRQIVYPGAVPLETDLLNTNRNILIALGLLAQDIFGSSTVVGGLPCTPTAPASLNVLVGPGRIYAQENVDNVAYSTLPADTTDQIVKQGINLGTTQLACAAPTTAGFSVNYLIEAAYEDIDSNLVTLPYYNSGSPQNPFSGPNNLGTQQATQRQGVVQLQAKIGIPAPTGTQQTPSADSGFVGLYVVTVAFGQTTITGASIQVATGAPFISSLLLTEPIADGRYLKLSGGSLVGALAGTTGSFLSLTVNGVNVQNAGVLTGGSIAPSLIPLSAVLQYEASLAIGFSQLTGQIASAQVPLASVQQYQGNLSIGFGQLTGTISNAQVPSSAVIQWESSLIISWGQISGTKNAQQLNGLTAGPNGSYSPNTLAQVDSSGYLYAAYFNQASSNSENPAVSQVMVTNGSDGFLRKCSLPSLESQMSLSSIGGLLNAASQLSGTVPNSHLPNIAGLPGVTIGADPGSVPVGSPGQMFLYY